MKKSVIIAQLDRALVDASYESAYRCYNERYTQYLNAHKGQLILLKAYITVNVK